jgi:U3 small nucleolar RNA-associated protein 12
LEEEREKEMEALYDAGITDTMNRDDSIGSGAGDAPQPSEVAGVSKQTTETLMAGERIMEALDLADGERAAFAAWEADKATLSEEAAAKLPPPERNPVLKAYDMEPEKYVLTVVEKVQAPALFDALLVLPFGKVTSLMTYLNEWARRVCYSLPCRRIFFLTVVP